MEEIPSGTGGVKPIPIQGILFRERARLAGLGMTEAERKMRAQWVRDQVLAPHEPVHVPELQQELLNPIRRFYRWPLDTLMKPLEPKLGPEVFPVARLLAGKLLIGWFSIYAMIYYFKYNQNDWTRESGWRVLSSRVRVLPGDPGYPKVIEMKPQDYATRGFDKSPI